MVSAGYGKVAKNLRNQRPSITFDQILNSLKPHSWEDVFEANQNYLEQIVQEAKDFIHDVVTSHPSIPTAVAYSGGKDSLCTLLLVYETLGAKFEIFFADTGLELPETTENTNTVVKLLNMEQYLHIRYAKEKFWDLAKYLGPPGRDFRFCCHGLKAQRINEIIDEVAPGKKVLSFLGQRRYESFSRAAEKRVYVNSFIPNQIAAAPIKNWNALEVWLYILYYPHYVDGKLVSVPINNLYYQEFERIGCYLCPASDLATLKILRRIHPEMMKKWDDWLITYAEKNDLPEEWVKFGLWRFKSLDPQWKNAFEKYDVDYQKIMGEKPPIVHVDPNSDEHGVIDLPIDLEILHNLFQVLPGNSLAEKDQLIFENRIFKFLINGDGSFVLQHSTSPKKRDKFLRHVLGLILKSVDCANCGVCGDICPKSLITIEKRGDRYIPVVNTSTDSSCIHCLDCITHCVLYQKIKER
jgi:phosphoadenosine phosphosulfate reductase